MMNGNAFFVALAVFTTALTAPAAASGAEPQVGKTFKECDGCPEMVVVPAGTFQMAHGMGSGLEL